MVGGPAKLTRTAAALNPTFQALRAIASIPEEAWLLEERACPMGGYHIWGPAMYVHADPGGRLQFWRCRRCGAHKLQVVKSDETVYT